MTVLSLSRLSLPFFSTDEEYLRNENTSSEIADRGTKTDALHSRVYVNQIYVQGKKFIISGYFRWLDDRLSAANNVMVKTMSLTKTRTAGSSHEVERISRTIQLEQLTDLKFLKLQSSNSTKLHVTVPVDLEVLYWTSDGLLPAGHEAVKDQSIKRSWMQAHRSSGQSAIVLSSSRRGGRWWCLLKVILLLCFVLFFCFSFFLFFFFFLFFSFFFVHNSGYGDRDWSRWSTQAVSDTGSGGCPPEVVMAGAVLVVVVVGTGSGCRACMSQVWEPRFFRSWNNSYFGYVSI